MAIFVRISSHTLVTILAISTIVLSGTLYSIAYETFLDTSNPLLAHLPHPADGHSYFANKRNVLNQVFVKKAWAWTSGVFWLVWAAGGGEGTLAIGRWLGATAAWASFASWFFGPSLFERIGFVSGRECVVHDPSSASTFTVPQSFCQTQQAISPSTHPTLFSLQQSALEIDPSVIFKPRFYRGHDVSGHTFLLTMSVLFLVDQLSRTRRMKEKGLGAGGVLGMVSEAAGWGLVTLWMVMLGATAVYFHTWEEKFSGFMIGVAGYAISQAPFRSRRTVPSLMHGHNK